MKKYLYRSIALHITVLLIFVVDLPMFHRQKITLGQAPIIVDLKDVKLAEMTNLPPKAVFGEEDKKASVTEKTPPKFTKEEPAPKPEPKPEVKKAELPIESFVAPEPEPKPEPKKEPESKPTPKPEPKPKPAPKPEPKPKPKPEPKKEPTKKPAEKPKQPEVKTITNPLKSLMDSVSAMEKELAEQNSPAVIKTGTEVANMGVEGGTGGSYKNPLSISQREAFSNILSKCWTLDPGVMGIENMIIEIRAFLNKDGTLRDVQIVDKARFAADPHFAAVAITARRAVWTCQNHNNINIYKIFADKYADKYKMWSTLRLKFNPMDASVH